MLRRESVQLTFVPESKSDDREFTRRWAHIPRTGDQVRLDNEWWLITEIYWHSATMTETEEAQSQSYAMITLMVVPKP